MLDFLLEEPDVEVPRSSKLLHCPISPQIACTVIPSARSCCYCASVPEECHPFSSLVDEPNRALSCCVHSSRRVLTGFSLLFSSLVDEPHRALSCCVRSTHWVLTSPPPLFCPLVDEPQRCLSPCVHSDHWVLTHLLSLIFDEPHRALSFCVHSGRWV